MCISAPHLCLLPGGWTRPFGGCRLSSCAGTGGGSPAYARCRARRCGGTACDEVDAFHLHVAAHRAVQSGDDAHQDGLAGAVGDDHRNRLAGDIASLQADRAGANVPDSMSDMVNRSEPRPRHHGDETDARQPNATARWARRTHPLAALKRAEAHGRDQCAVRRGRREPARCNRTIATLAARHAPFRGTRRAAGPRVLSERQLKGVRCVRCALVLRDNVRDGGTIRGYAVVARVRHTIAAEWLRSGLSALADHYRFAVPRVA